MTPIHRTVTALLYSGRPDPRWEINVAQLEHLKVIWNALTESHHPPHSPPALGYRGCVVRGARCAQTGVVCLRRNGHFQGQYRRRGFSSGCGAAVRKGGARERAQGRWAVNTESCKST